MLTAITRAVGPRIGDCQLTYLERQSINAEKAMREQREYEKCLEEIGVRVISLPSEPSLPDAVFVEDTAVIVDEVAVIAAMGAATRRQEVVSMADVLSRYRPLEFINHNGTLEGGDVVQVGRRLYVGISTRTNYDGVVQLREILQRYDYEVIDVEVPGCLHLTTGCTYIGRNTLLVNKSWVNTARLADCEIIDTDPMEPWAANALLAGDTVVVSTSHPKTKGKLMARGFIVKSVDIAELEKAEAGLTCMSLLFNDKGSVSDC